MISHVFKISGFRPEVNTLDGGSIMTPGGQLKSQARKASHRVDGCDDPVGPVVRFEYKGQIETRPLTRREMVFGMKSPDDGNGGGFAGLVAWCGYAGTQRAPEICIDLYRAQVYGANQWIIHFVSEIIRWAGWTVLSGECR